jgi:hypothetical protein
LVTDADATGALPPRPLGAHGMALWRAVTAEYTIQDAGGVELLCQACQAADRVEALAAQISQDGEVVRTRAGARSHPGLKDEVQLRAFIVRTIEKLGLNFEAVRPTVGLNRVIREHQCIYWAPPTGHGTPLARRPSSKLTAASAIWAAK